MTLPRGLKATRYRLSVVSCQLSVISYQLSVIGYRLSECIDVVQDF